MKTLEFPLYLNPGQKADLAEWLETLQHVYNRGLALLEWRQFYNRFQQVLGVDPDYASPVAINTHKQGEDWALYCDRTVKVRIDKTKSWDAENIDFRPACHLVKPHWLEPPLIDGANAIALRKPFARKRYDKLGTIPQIYVNDYISLVLAPAWAKYIDPKRPEVRKPRYKGRRDRVDTIPSESFRAACQLDFKADKIKMPGLGWVFAPGLANRLEPTMERQKAHMLKHPELYPELAKKLEEREAFLTVARWIERCQTVPEDLTPVLKMAYKKAQEVAQKTDSADRAIAKLRELAGRREINCAIEDLCTPGSFHICRQGNKFVVQITARSLAKAGNPRPEPVGVDLGYNLLADTTNGVQIKHPALEHYTAKIKKFKQRQSTLKLGGRKWKELQVKISKLERKKTRCKRSKHHYVAGWLVDANQNIAIKKVDPKAATGRPLPVPKEDNSGYAKNGREDQRVINNQVREIALGQFVALIQSKAKDRGLDRAVEIVECSPEASPREVLVSSSLVPDQPESYPQLEELTTPANPPRRYTRRKRRPVVERKTV